MNDNEVVGKSPATYQKGHIRKNDTGKWIWQFLYIIQVQNRPEIKKFRTSVESSVNLPNINFQTYVLHKDKRH